MYSNNLDLLLDLKRQLEAVIDRGSHRLECISRACESGPYTLNEIASLGMRFASTTKAPPEFDDITGVQLAQRPSYRFPCPSNAHMRLSMLYHAKQLVCSKPIFKIIEVSLSTKQIEVSSIENCTILYKINESIEQQYLNPIIISGSGKYVIHARCVKQGYTQSDISETCFEIKDQSQSPKSKTSRKLTGITSGINKYRGLHLIRASQSSDDSDNCHSSEESD
ncbi:uncharacterized protein CMU_014880 [Cryptosporidium muris RN66]|uniref:Uncharacterized protein n=1 Tax=Cryptosporidium muris (strain RN66) TaxID=441375 RepID=B6AF45_CRYMR|nr:uncharacterized protein CMU_014880 [Cryptosporidium muris RN66]EEA06812.1 hypothetical protein, conserved [Cryptosporidium muris RN66]|eukprot:XP_002141161.1 hypothetical protein [Cryptosporidium muris RN66]